MKHIRNIFIIIIIFIQALLSSSPRDKFLKIIVRDNLKYISLNEFTDKFDIQNSFEIITGRGKLLCKGSVAIYQIDFSVMLINNKLSKSIYPVIKSKGEILFPIQFFSNVIDEFFPYYRYIEKENMIYIEYTDTKASIKLNNNIENKSHYPQDRIGFIVIDPGHGGKDPGAIGKGSIKEKTITLKIAKRLEEYLNVSNLKNIKIKLTRNSDSMLELANRTEIANRLLKINENGIFISIHVNASIVHSISGFETYFLSQNPSNEEARATAALENNVKIFEDNSNRKAYNDVEHVEAIMLNTQIQKESNILANCIQKNMDKNINISASKGVKKADFFVLRGSLMPAVLVEVGYISNPKEADRLKKADYQKVIAQGIGNGIMQFINEYNKNFKK